MGSSEKRRLRTLFLFATKILPKNLGNKGLHMAHSSIVRTNRVRLALVTTLLSSTFLVSPAWSGGALPTDGSFAAGAGSIANSASQTTVNQSTQRGIINWGSF